MALASANPRPVAARKVVVQETFRNPGRHPVISTIAIVSRYLHQGFRRMGWLCPRSAFALRADLQATCVSRSRGEATPRIFDQYSS